MEFLASDADFTGTFRKALTQDRKPAAPSRSLSLPDKSPVLFQNWSSRRLFIDVMTTLYTYFSRLLNRTFGLKELLFTSSSYAGHSKSFDLHLLDGKVRLVLLDREERGHWATS